ncbi:hypothetical protein C8J56DRAFT_821453 [Mycena floridula]|nr:hypothetical protein C8J56DRAFT_821453 [Mycena floridula]
MPVPLRVASSLKVEAKFNVVTEFPNFDLHSAAAAGNIGLVEYALTRGQPVNSVLDGVLPLHAACAGGDEQVVKLLIEHGADVNAPRLPRKYSTGGNRDASAPIVGTSGSTPLHFAAANGNKNIITTLLLRGAHADRADKHGVTPEMLANQHGWVECAQVLRTWVENKDRDLRERAAPLVSDEQVTLAANRERHGSFGTEPEASGTGRRRLQVKRSIDTALNMLKVSSTGLSEAYLRPSASPMNVATPSPPASPNRGEYPSFGTPSDEGRFSPSPSPIDPGPRRPSLPHIFSLPPATASRPAKPATLTKPQPSPRRPRSAGTDAENEAGHPPFGRGGAARMLGTKYSLMNMFKKAQGENGVPLERSPSHQTSSSISGYSMMSSSPMTIDLTDNAATPTSSSFPRPSRFRKGSDASAARPRAPSGSQSQVPQFMSGSPSHRFSPPNPTVPLAVDLHNALAQQRNQTRDRAGSSSSALGISFEESSGSGSGSPLTRLGLLRARPLPQGHSRDRSGSGGSIRSGGVYDEDIVGDMAKGKSRQGILRTHTRSTSTGQSQSALRPLRFDHSPNGTSVLREDENSRLWSAKVQDSSTSSLDSPPVNRVPDSAPAAIGDFGRGGLEEEEESYGSLLDQFEVIDMPRPGMDRDISFSSDSSSSPALFTGDVHELPASSDFPFSINNPPIATDEADLSLPVDNRGRGDSVSSTSTTDSRTNPNLSASGTTTSGSGGSLTITTPILATGEFMGLSLEPPSPIDGDDKDLPLEELHMQNFIDGLDSEVIGLNERRGNATLDLNMSLISSHAQAAALVQRTQQDILDLAQPGSLSPESLPSDGWSPLSARLAAFGESLALEKKLREQKEATNNGEIQSPSELASPRSTLGPSSPAKAGVNRQFSLENKSRSRQREPRRPHTSSGASSVSDINASSSGHQTSAENQTHHPGSRSVGTLDALYPEQAPRRPLLRSRTPDTDDRLSRMSSLDGLDTDSELGQPLTRVATAPLASSNPAKARRDQTRNMASATKLARMGFSPNNESTARAPPKRFGGLKSLVRSLKSKP